MKKIFLLIKVFLVTFCYSQNDKPFRESFYLDIVADLENNYGMEIEKSPYFVKEKILQIYPSEKLLIETEIKNDTIFSMKIVTENLNPEKTIEIEFTQNAADRNNIMMMLNVKNPFNKKLLYNAFMYTPKSNNWISTSIMPVRPKLQGFEIWSHAIITLVLEDWRLE